MKTVSLIAAAMLIAAVCIARVGPDSVYPPKGITGEADPAVTQATIHQTICVPNYTMHVRAVTEADKKFVIKRDGTTQPVEVDHLISLELGGTNNRDKNLWAEAYAGDYGARKKDVVETALHRLICAASDPMPLAVAQKCIVSDWIACGKKIGVIQ